MISFLYGPMGKRKLYCKATDCHQYLYYDPSHPDHIKKSSIYSQGLRIKRLCPDNHKLQKYLVNLLKTGLVKEVILKV